MSGEPAVGKISQVEQLQRRASGAVSGAAPAQVHEAAQAGTSGPSQPLPHLSKIQQLFGRHDVAGIEAHVGGPAEHASKQMGANAYATGNAVAFANAPDLHTAAHEAAHVVQQRSGVQLKGGVGDVGDPYEQHADAVADRVVRGESAEDLLSEKGGGGGTAVQRSASAGASVPGRRSAPELLEEAIDVMATALVLARGSKPGDAEAPAPAAPQASPETVSQLQTAHRELLKLQGASEDEIRAAVTPILSSIGAPGMEAPGTGQSTGAPVQRNTLVLGAPLLGAGPPGWVVYGILAVGTVGITGYVMYRANRSRAEREQAASTSTTATDTQQTQHRGRIQVQGGGLEMSFPWAQPVPMVKVEALAGMEALRATLSRRQLEDRTEAFASAATFINTTLHTCPPQVSRTFQNRAVRQRGGDERVDIEIRTGIAFA